MCSFAFMLGSMTIAQGQKCETSFWRSKRAFISPPLGCGPLLAGNTSSLQPSHVTPPENLPSQLADEMHDWPQKQVCNIETQIDFAYRHSRRGKPLVDWGITKSNILLTLHVLPLARVHHRKRGSLQPMNLLLPQIKHILHC